MTSLVDQARLTDEEQDHIFAAYYNDHHDVSILVKEYGEAQLAKAVWVFHDLLFGERLVASNHLPTNPIHFQTLERLWWDLLKDLKAAGLERP